MGKFLFKKRIPCSENTLKNNLLVHASKQTDDTVQINERGVSVKNNHL